MARTGALALCLTLVAPATLAQEQPSWELGGYVIEMSLADYRAYVRSAPPLDRLSCTGDGCRFLVSDRELASVMESGVRFLLSSPTVSGASTSRSERGDINGLYHTYRETEAKLLQLAADFPELAEVSSVGRSVEGRELYVIKLSDQASLAEQETEPNVFFVGCHHAREWISVEVPLLFAEYLLEHYDDDPEVRRLVDGAQIFILPLMNPDGLEFSIRTYRWWRKNRRYNGDYRWGVDLNRNYGWSWGYDDEGSSGDPASNVYRGPVAFSEPESQAVRDFLTANPPAMAVSYHNYSQVILYPWGYTAEPTDDDLLMHQLAGEMSARMLQVSGRSYSVGSGATALYFTNGGFTDWVYGTFGAPAFTVELPNQDYPSGAFFTSMEEIARTFQENLPAMMYLIDFAISGDPGSRGPIRPGRSPRPLLKRSTTSR